MKTLLALSFALFAMSSQAATVCGGVSKYGNEFVIGGENGEGVDPRTAYLSSRAYRTLSNAARSGSCLCVRGGLPNLGGFTYVSAILDCKSRRVIVNNR